MSYLILCSGCKANKCSCFTPKKWQEGLANLGNGAIISALVRRAAEKNSTVKIEKISIVEVGVVEARVTSYKDSRMEMR